MSEPQTFKFDLDDPEWTFRVCFIVAAVTLCWLVSSIRGCCLSENAVLANKLDSCTKALGAIEVKK